MADGQQDFFQQQKFNPVPICASNSSLGPSVVGPQGVYL